MRRWGSVEKMGRHYPDEFESRQDKQWVQAAAFMPRELRQVEKMNDRDSREAPPMRFASLEGANFLDTEPIDGGFVLYLAD